MTRSEAAKLGLPRYNTGRPCNRGHHADRYVSSGICTECAKTYVNNYNRKIKSAMREAQFGAPADPLTTPRVMIPRSLCGQVEPFLEALASHDARALNLLALWASQP